MKRYLVSLCILLCAQHAYAGANSVLDFGNTSLMTSNTAPTLNQALCLASGGITGCTISGGGGSPAGSTGTLQTNGGSNTFGAYGGTTCTNQAVSALSAAGAATCSTITSSYVNNTIAQTGVDINTSNQVTATHLASALPASQGGSGIASPTQFSILYGNGSAAFGTLVLTNDQVLQGSTGAAPQALALVNCGDSTHALAYSTTSHLFSCQAITGSSTAGGTTGQINFNSGGALAGLSGTGLVKSNAPSAPSIAVSGTDYAAPYSQAATTLTMGGLI